MKKVLISFIAIVLTYSSFSQKEILVNKTPVVLQPANPESAGFSTERLHRIDSNIYGWMKEGPLNGCVALIVHNGKIVYHKAFGYDDLARTKPLKTDNIFRIASQTKAITSAAIMVLYEEGKFLLDDPVSKYIPEFAHQQVLDSFHEKDTTYTTVPTKSEVTIRQLLTHTSGISYPQIGSDAANAINYKAGLLAGVGVGKGRSLAADVKKIAKLPLMHQPGQKWTYGFNVDILGYLVEYFSGKTLAQFFKERIFEPFGMNDTYFYLPESKYNRLVTLYKEQDGKLIAPEEIMLNGKFIANYPKMDNNYYSGGGGLSSTTLDYAKFLQMILNGGKFNGHRLLARNTVRMMTMNQIGDIEFGGNKFGLGFAITTEEGSSVLPTPKGVIEWGGAFATTYWADPKENLIGIIYRQIWGTSRGDDPDKFKVLVYQALE